MKRFAALLAGAAALALSACGDADEPVENTTVVETDTAAPAPTATETTVIRETDEADVGDDSVTVGEDGVEVDVNEGDTSVQADLDDDPSVTVRD